MGFYISIFILLLISSVWSFYLSNIKSTLLYIGLVSLLTIFAALRFETGYDWDYYKMIFNESEWGYVWGNKNAEPLYVLSCMLVKQIGGSFIVIAAMFSIIAVVLKTTFIYKKSVLPVVSLFLMLPMFFKFDMGMMRQSMAMAIVMWSTIYVQKRNFGKFLILILLAAGFHFSALLFIPVYWVFEKTFKYSISVILIVSALLVDLFLRRYLPVIFELAFEHISHKFEAYYSNDFRYSFMIPSLYWRLLVYTIVFIYSKKMGSKEILFFNNIYLLGILYFILFSSIFVLSDRGSLYFKLFEIITIPFVLQRVFLSYKKQIFYLALTIIFLYCTRHFYFQMSEDYRFNYMPYRTLICN